MPSSAIEQLSQLSNALIAYWPTAVILGIVIFIVMIWLMVRRRFPAAKPSDSMQRHPSSASMPVPVLRGISGEFCGSLIELDEEPVLIGRDPKLCQLVFPASMQSISKRHCIIRYHARSQCFLLVDCNSANGTFIADAERLPNGGSQLLVAGQRFYLSGPDNMFEVNFEAPR
jgi:hypothetical protein